MKWFKFLIAFFVLATTVVADEQSTNRVISNPVENGDLVLRINNAGTPNNALSISGTTAVTTLSQPLPVASGGTNATNTATARTNLGLGSIATVNSPVPVANGGTGATTDSVARTNLGVAIGTNVQAYDADLSTIAGLAKTADNFIVANGTNWTLETPTNARASLGLGDLAVESGPLAKDKGGTGITTTATFPASGVIVTDTSSTTMSNKTLSSPTVTGQISMNSAEVKIARVASGTQHCSSACGTFTCVLAHDMTGNAGISCLNSTSVTKFCLCANVP